GGGECAGGVVKVGDGVGGAVVGPRMMGRCGGGLARGRLKGPRGARGEPGRAAWGERGGGARGVVRAYPMVGAQSRVRGGGQWLLVSGVSSGVGVAAVQTAKAFGARVIGTSGSADKLARLEKLGLDLGIRTRAGDFHDAVMKATDGKGVNLVVNNVGGSM